MNPSLRRSYTWWEGKASPSSLMENLAWAHGCRKRGLECEQVTHQVKQFTRPVMRKPSSVLSSVAGTQSIDRGMACTQSLATPKIEDIRKREMAITKLVKVCIQ